MQPPRTQAPKLYAVNPSLTVGRDWCEPVKQHMLQGLAALTQQLFSALDDLFYDLSQRATNSQEAQLYFESLRAVRLAHQGLTDGFQQGMNAAFNEWCGQEQEPAPSSIALALLDGDALEMDLAQNTMSYRARDLFRVELQSLQALLASQLSQDVLSERRNPLDPHAIAHAFVRACQQHLDIPLKALLIVFKLFEKEVLSQLGQVYQTLLNHLKQAGFTPVVLPVEAASSPQEPPVAPQEVSVDVAFNVLLEAVRSVVSQEGRYSQHAGPIMPSNEFALQLGGFQQQVNTQLDVGPPRNFIGQIANDILKAAAQVAPAALIQADEDIINLIALFFDEVLADDSLPLVIQTLVCRLQIPLLKIALREADFFKNIQHPARGFINLLSAAALLLDDTKPLDQDALYPSLADWVQRLSHNPQVDTAHFVQALEALQPLLEKQQRRQEKLELRTQQTEAGRHRLEQARLAAQGLIYSRIRELALPETLSQFLVGPWLQALVFIHLRHGESSLQWQQAEQVVIDVLWLSHAHADVRSHSRSQRLLPDVRQHLLEGLSFIELDEAVRLQRVAQLLQAITQAQVPAPSGQSEAVAPCLTAETPEDALALTPIQRQMARHEALMAEHYATTKTFTAGTWMAFTDDASGQVTKAKLSSFLDGETALFVNGFGAKVFEKTRQQLALDLQRKRLRLLDGAPWFDRMMRAVSRKLHREEP